MDEHFYRFLKTDFKQQDIGTQLIQYVIKYFSLKNISAKTDNKVVGFYRALGFECTMFEGKYGKRYICCS